MNKLNIGTKNMDAAEVELFKKRIDGLIRKKKNKIKRIDKIKLIRYYNHRVKG